MFSRITRWRLQSSEVTMATCEAGVLFFCGITPTHTLASSSTARTCCNSVTFSVIFVSLNIKENYPSFPQFYFKNSDRFVGGDHFIVYLGNPLQCFAISALFPVQLKTFVSHHILCWQNKTNKHKQRKNLSSFSFLLFIYFQCT